MTTNNPNNFNPSADLNHGNMWYSFGVHRNVLYADYEKGCNGDPLGSSFVSDSCRTIKGHFRYGENQGDGSKVGELPFGFDIGVSTCNPEEFAHMVPKVIAAAVVKSDGSLCAKPGAANADDSKLCDLERPEGSFSISRRKDSSPIKTYEFNLERASDSFSNLNSFYEFYFFIMSAMQIPKEFIVSQSEMLTQIKEVKEARRKSKSEAK